MATSAKDFAINLLNYTNNVVLYSVIPRTKKLSSSPEVFTENMKMFNAKLSKLCKEQSRIHFERMRGFYADGVNNDRVVDDWSDDGIHLRTQTNKNGLPPTMPVYQKRLRYTTLAYVP